MDNLTIHEALSWWLNIRKYSVFDAFLGSITIMSLEQIFVNEVFLDHSI